MNNASLREQRYTAFTLSSVCPILATQNLSGWIMNTAFSKLLIVFSMLVAFSGQSLAYAFEHCAAVSVRSPTTSASGSASGSALASNVGDRHGSLHHQSHQQMTSDNNQHTLHVASKDMNHQESCCVEECVCKTSACSAVSIIASYHYYFTLQAISERVAAQQVNSPKSVTSLLYRPPISS